MSETFYRWVRRNDEYAQENSPWEPAEMKNADQLLRVGFDYLEPVSSFELGDYLLYRGASKHGVLEVGLTEAGNEILVNHPAIQQNETGGFLTFTPAQAREFAKLLEKKSQDIDPQPSTDILLHIQTWRCVSIQRRRFDLTATADGILLRLMEQIVGSEQVACAQIYITLQQIITEEDSSGYILSRIDEGMKHIVDLVEKGPQRVIPASRFDA